MDATEFEQKSREYRRALLAYAFTCCRDLNLAEDIVQETLLIAFQKREQYFREADFGAWLISIARNVWFKVRDQRKITQRAAQFVEANATLLFDRDSYDEDRWQDERRALGRCLEKLADVDRDIIAAHFTRRLNYAEIAERMRRTLSWVKVRMFRARAALLDCVRLATQPPSGGRSAP
jgi:RNA polymerase sigma-70 factor (ECF subfamily)